MSKIVQICGTHGTGKTTLIKGLLNAGDFMRLRMQIDGKEKEWWYDGRIAVIGKYAQNNCCGLDSGDYTRNQLITQISTILSQIKPSVIIFEDVRFGGSYSFKEKVLNLAQDNDYEYVCVALLASLETICERVIRRSGNPNANWDNARSKARSIIKSTRRISDIGAKVYFLDTEKLSKQDLFRKVSAVING